MNQDSSAQATGKRAAAEEAVRRIESGMTVGLGTGSTAVYAIRKIGEFVQGGLSIRAVATSVQSERLARELGIPISPFADIDGIDVTIDGADEVDGAFNAIKGGGGALLREKIVAAASRTLILVVDESKVVRRLGAFPLPVEIVPFGKELTLAKLTELGGNPVVRLARDGSVYTTDNGNYIADCNFGSIGDPGRLTAQLNAIPGVVENGLFVGMASGVIVGRADGSAAPLVRQS
ncbi:ribose-5-phosphate isomerase RpiA [Paenibacillus humicola]|uniref:ribose-5-phosphate isomerase RpiA n=1 Tax=Paenibacillus humicola TaxID=3110540 RepID=UPI00237A8290|nr:ribose-5-phosphate isomerase RpiA [Paenibacillus humicola]